MRVKLLRRYTEFILSYTRMPSAQDEKHLLTQDEQRFEVCQQIVPRTSEENNTRKDGSDQQAQIQRVTIATTQHIPLSRLHPGDGGSLTNERRRHHLTTMEEEVIVAALFRVHASI